MGLLDAQVVFTITMIFFTMYEFQYYINFLVISFAFCRDVFLLHAIFRGLAYSIGLSLTHTNTNSHYLLNSIVVGIVLLLFYSLFMVFSFTFKHFYGFWCEWSNSAYST